MATPYDTLASDPSTGVGYVDPAGSGWRVILKSGLPAWDKSEVEAESSVNTHADLPDPTTVNSGTVMVVVNDPSPNLNGEHVAAGSDTGQPALHWTKS